VDRRQHEGRLKQDLPTEPEPLSKPAAQIQPKRLSIGVIVFQ
jgi:hypothetical protein